MPKARYKPTLPRKSEVVGGSLGLAAMGGTHVPKDMSLNPGTVYWMDIFSHLFINLICV